MRTADKREVSVTDCFEGFDKMSGVLPAIVEENRCCTREDSLGGIRLRNWSLRFVGVASRNPYVVLKLGNHWWRQGRLKHFFRKFTV